MSVHEEREVLEGYVVDIACVRRYPQKEIAERARKHTRKCALTGHCIESGYALINSSGNIVLLDAKATAKILDLVREDGRKTGIQARVRRIAKEGQMETIAVKSI